MYVFDGTFTMNGGTITGCVTDGEGGVYVAAGGTFTMNAGEISGNSAEYGGGVDMYSGTMTISGCSVIAGNTNSVGEANNVWLLDGRKMSVNDLAPGASIGVTTETLPDSETYVPIATGAGEDDVPYFHSDNPGYHAAIVSGELGLVVGAALPAYLDGANEAVVSNYMAWAAKYGPDATGTHRTAFLLDIDPATVIPEGSNLLKVVAFRFSTTSLHLEVASDVAEFREKGSGIPMVGNGFLVFRIAESLSSNPNDWHTIGPVPVEIRNGNAVIDLSDSGSGGSGGEIGTASGGGIGSAPGGAAIPSSYFIKVGITDRLPEGGVR